MRQRTLGPPPHDHDTTLPAPALQAQLALLALPTGAGIMPILRAHRSLDRTLYPFRQAQLEQIWLATLLRLPHDRLVAPTGVAAQQRGPFRPRQPPPQAPHAPRPKPPRPAAECFGV